VIARSNPARLSPYLQLFLYLQVLDFLTTMVGFKIGLQEISPVVKQFVEIHPALGVGASKLAAVGLAGICVMIGRAYLIRWINYWYAALVVWNLCIMLVARRGA
jgi:hypothetical protein